MNIDVQQNGQHIQQQNHQQNRQTRKHHKSSRLFLASLLVSLILAAGCSTNNAETKDLVKLPDQTEEELLQEAMNAYDSKLYSISRENWTELRDGYPASYFVPLAELKIADSYYFAEDYRSAYGAYDEFIRSYPAHEARPYAKYQLALSQIAQYRGVHRDQTPIKEGLKILKQLVTEMPQSEYAYLAHRKIEECRALLAEYGQTVAQYYEKKGEHRAALSREKNLRIDEEIVDYDRPSSPRILDIR